MQQTPSPEGVFAFPTKTVARTQRIFKKDPVISDVLLG
jgi:hypothetical protein